MSNTTGWLNIYAQPAWHDEAYVVGDETGLRRLIDAIDQALEMKSGDRSVYCGDGEGFDVCVRCADAETVSRLVVPYTHSIAAEAESQKSRHPRNLFRRIRNTAKQGDDEQTGRPEFVLDGNGYPTTATLKTIRGWPLERDYKVLLEEVSGLVQKHGYAECSGGADDDGSATFVLATGGWSGNESIIDALNGNAAFWGLCWRSSERGGRFVFDLSRTATT